MTPAELIRVSIIMASYGGSMTRPNIAGDADPAVRSPEFLEFLRNAPEGMYDLLSDPVESPEERRLIEQAEQRSRERQAQPRE